MSSPQQKQPEVAFRWEEAVPPNPRSGRQRTRGEAAALALLLCGVGYVLLGVLFGGLCSPSENIPIRTISTCLVMFLGFYLLFCRSIGPIKRVFTAVPCLALAVVGWLYLPALDAPSLIEVDRQKQAVENRFDQLKLDDLTEAQELTERFRVLNAYYEMNYEDHLANIQERFFQRCAAEFKQRINADSFQDLEGIQKAEKTLVDWKRTFNRYPDNIMAWPQILADPMARSQKKYLRSLAPGDFGGWEKRMAVLAYFAEKFPQRREEFREEKDAGENEPRELRLATQKEIRLPRSRSLLVHFPRN